MNLALFDRMRQALAHCTFPPGSPPKRFARNVAAVPLDSLTEAQRRHIIRLCWRYRRQSPRDLVPSKDAVEALDAADRLRQRLVEPARTATRRRKPVLVLHDGPAFPDLFGFIGP